MNPLHLLVTPTGSGTNDRVKAESPLNSPSQFRDRGDSSVSLFIGIRRDWKALVRSGA